jgi:hypothetical protein
MWTIENYIFDPFGKPESDPHGHGSTQAFKLLNFEGSSQV